MPAIDHTTLHLALRSHLLDLLVLETEVTTLAATATGYQRATGSFVADGFRVGMEVKPVGFIDNSPSVLTHVTDLAVEVAGGRTPEASGALRKLSVLLPSARGWENVPLTPPADRPYVEEDYIPGPMEAATVGAPDAEFDLAPEYVLNYYGVLNSDVGAIGRTADAIINHFAAGSTLLAANGVVLRVSAKPAPYRTQIVRLDNHAVTTITVPLWARYTH